MRNRSFTFIEVCLVAMMISITSLAIYSSFKAGTKIWQMVSSGNPQTDACIFLDKLSSDLRNCFIYSSIVPVGKKNELSFGLMQEGRSDSQDFCGFGRVLYSYDAQNKLVFRSYKSFNQILQDSQPGSGSLMLKNISSLEFSYYYKEGGGIWKENFIGVFPCAVKVGISFVSNNRMLTLTKIVPIYISG